MACEHRPLAGAPVRPDVDWPSDLERDGYVILCAVIGHDKLAELDAALDELQPGGPGLERGGSVYAMRNLLNEVPATRRLAGSEPLAGLARRVLGPGAFVVRGLLFDKNPEANWMVPWHQDLTIAVKARRDVAGYGPWTVKAGITHVQPPTPVLERMLTLRVHLDDSGAALGPLRVVPGSHVEGRLDAEATRRWLGRAAPRACLVPRGGVLAMRPLLLHASSPADAPGRRRVVHLEYAADPLPGGVEWFEPECPRT